MDGIAAVTEIIVANESGEFAMLHGVVIRNSFNMGHTCAMQANTLTT